MHPLAGLLCQRQPNVLQLQSNVSHDNVMTVLQGDAKVYEAECASSPGFSVNFTNQESRGTTYAEFRKLNLKWQQKVGKVRRWLSPVPIQTHPVQQIRCSMAVVFLTSATGHYMIKTTGTARNSARLSSSKPAPV